MLQRKGSVTHPILQTGKLRQGERPKLERGTGGSAESNIAPAFQATSPLLSEALVGTSSPFPRLGWSHFNLSSGNRTWSMLSGPAHEPVTVSAMPWKKGPTLLSGLVELHEV